MNEPVDISAALADEMRLRIINLLWQSELCVKCLVSALRAPQPTVSRHLSHLHKAGLIKKSRKESHVYCRLDFGGGLAQLKKDTLGAYRRALSKRMPYAADRKRLKTVATRCDAECTTPFLHTKRKGTTSHENPR